MKNAHKEITALNRVLDLLEEYSFGYLASQDHRFDSTVAGVYQHVSQEISKLEHGSSAVRLAG